jgi:hypothetical protein
MSNFHKYDAIINQPHHVSTRHVPMSASDRAAQFSPFAALNGHESAIEETARLTESRLELDDDQMELLDERLRLIRTRLAEHPVVTFTYFQSDEKKSGGTYVTATGVVKKIRDFEREVVLEDGTTLPIGSLADIVLQNLSISPQTGIG